MPTKLGGNRRAPVPSMTLSRKKKISFQHKEGEEGHDPSLHQGEDAEEEHASFLQCSIDSCKREAKKGVSAQFCEIHYS